MCCELLAAVVVSHDGWLVLFRKCMQAEQEICSKGVGETYALAARCERVRFDVRLTQIMRLAAEGLTVQRLTLRQRPRSTEYLQALAVQTSAFVPSPGLTVRLALIDHSLGVRASQSWVKNWMARGGKTPEYFSGGSWGHWT